MLDLGSGVVGGAHGWVAGRAGLWGVPPTWVWVVGFSPQILEHPTSICNTGINGNNNVLSMALPSIAALVHLDTLTNFLTVYMRAQCNLVMNSWFFI